MSQEHVRLVYDGPALQSHAMDVRDLAPALLSLGDLCREANKVVNGDRAVVKVLVHSDFEHGCFQISFEVVQTLYEHVKDLLQDESIADAKNVLEWLGILASGPAGLIGLFAYLKFRKGRPISSETTISVHGRDAIAITFQGDGNTVVLSPETHALSKDKRVIAAVKGVVRPLQIDGVDVAEFRQDDRPQERIDKENARLIADTTVPDDDEEIEPQRVTARLRIHTLSFDASSAKWRFWYGGETITADVSQTSIAEDAVRRGHVDIDDSYMVTMEIKERKTKRGFVNDYTIIRVLDFTPGRHQPDLPLPGHS